MNHSTFTFRTCLLLSLLASAAVSLQAQTVYRIVGADGKVSFSDRAPADASRATTTNASGKAISGGDNTGLPFELRQVAARYPVTLYSAVNCVPCNSGRLLLQGRGIPFNEFSVASPEDGEALKRLSGDNSLPFLTIGGQKIKGYSESEWTQYLAAANYPQTSVLSASYRQPPAKPLVVVQKPATPKPDDAGQGRIEEKSAENRAPTVPGPTPASPTGIRF